MAGRRQLSVIGHVGESGALAGAALVNDLRRAIFSASQIMKTLET